jgi:hypothetical protein
MNGGTGGGISGGTLGFSSIVFLPDLKLVTALGNDSFIV